MVSLLERKKKNMDVPRFEIEEIDIYNNDKLIKNVPHLVIPSIHTENQREYRHSLDVVYKIAAICDYLNQVNRTEFDFKDVDYVPEVTEKLNEAKYFKH